MSNRVWTCRGVVRQCHQVLEEKIVNTANETSSQVVKVLPISGLVQNFHTCVTLVILLGLSLALLCYVG